MNKLLLLPLLAASLLPAVPAQAVPALNFFQGLNDINQSVQDGFGVPRSQQTPFSEVMRQEAERNYQIQRNAGGQIPYTR